MMKDFVDPPVPRDFIPHIITGIPADEIRSYIDPRMLYGKFMGIRNDIVSLLATKDFSKVREMEGGEKAYEIFCEIEKVTEKYENPFLRPNVIYQFFPCNRVDQSLEIYRENKAVAKMEFPRNKKGLSIADYVLAKDQNRPDTIAFLVSSTNGLLKKEAKDLKARGKYLHSHILSSLGLVLAEAAAEFGHQQIRKSWQIGPGAGARFSFGYPSCPDLEYQQILFSLMDVEKNIGVKLTENYVMDPEASVSAIVLHHKNASF